MRPHRISRINPCFRKHCSLSRKEEGAVIAKTRDWLDKYLEIESILFPDEKDFAFRYPAGFPRKVHSFADVEAAAADLREASDLGLDCIEKLDAFLQFNQRAILQHSGHISMDDARRCSGAISHIHWNEEYEE